MTSNAKAPQDPAQRYQVIKKLDAGGMAEIFLAKSVSIQGMEKHVAIKRVLPSLTKNEKFIEMFLDEARLSILLNHANIVQVFDVSQSAGTYFIVMEYVDGFNVRHLFQRASEIGYRIPIEVACYVITEVCKGLEHAHTKRDMQGKHLRIVHRDLSPPNILVSRSGEVKITDFGLAKATSQLTKTDPGVVKGKYSYLSPEVTEGKPADLRADVFAAGIVLWELLANRRLFYGKTDVETVEMVRNAEVPALSKLNPDVGPELEAILAKSLARDPKRRYTSAREMGEELANFLAKRSLKSTSFDLSQMVERLFGPVGNASASATVEHASERQARIVGLIDEEIANLSMLGYSPQVRGHIGSEPLQAAKLEFGTAHRPRYDLSAAWDKSGDIRSLAPDTKERTQTLMAIEALQDLGGLASTLEEQSPSLQARAEKFEAAGVKAEATPQAAPAKKSSSLLWIILGLLGAGGAAAVAFLGK